VPQELDVNWLEEQADDEESLWWIRKSAEWQRLAFERNELPDERKEIALRLNGYEIWMEAGGAFSALEVYQEIFRDSSHFSAPGFSAQDARFVVDLGANHGFYALGVKQVSPACRVICVEPNPYVFPLLKRNIEVNGLKNVTLLNNAVAPERGRMRFDLLRQLHAISGKGLWVVHRPWLAEHTIETVEVQGLTLSDLIEDDEVDILKMDIEGAELDVLASSAAALQRVKRVVVERHTKELRGGIFQLLTQAGFDLIEEEDPQCLRHYGDMYFVRMSEEGAHSR
jgi:FkbM family methyltransferase